MKTKTIFYIVNVDWFFISHRLPLAMAMKNRGYNICILARDTGKREIIEKEGLKFIDIKFERSGRNPIEALKIIFKLAKLFKIYNPDIIHNVTLKPSIYGSLAVRLYKGRSIKIINAVSGLGYNFIDDRSSFHQLYLKKLIKFSYKTPVHFIFQNLDDMREYEKMNLLCDNNYKIIKGSGVDCHEFAYFPPVNKTKVEVILLARMLIDKGIRDFIEAAMLLKDDYFDKVRFLLVGDVDKDNRATMREDELSGAVIPNYLEWLGFMSDVKPILIKSDIACLPSYREGLPKSLIEAMAIGRPIVATDVPGCRDCVDHGINGFLVPVKNPKELAKMLNILIDNEPLRLTMGRASRKKVLEEMSLQRIIYETIEVYDKI